MKRSAPVLFVCLLALSNAPMFAGYGQILRYHDPLPGIYLVLLKADLLPEQVPELAQQLVTRYGGRVRYVMNNTVNLFSVEMSEAQAQALAWNPLVAQVEENAQVHLSAVQTLPPPAPLDWMRLWNLDRIDQSGTADNNAYQYCERASQVLVYLPDSGVMGDHQEFIDPGTGFSRVRRGACFAADCVENRGDTICPLSGGRTNDLSWSHGTAVASILGGRTVGVAKEVEIVPIRFYACQADQGATATTERLNWSLDWIRSTSNPDRNHRPAMVNMSVYVRPNDTLLAAHEWVINGLVNLELDANGNVKWSGIPVVVSANNHARADNDTSPARLAYRNQPSIASPGVASVARVISVGGTGRRWVDGVFRDVRWQCPMYDLEPCWTDTYINNNDVPEYGSNFGNSVDIYAPAHDVESAFTTTISAYRRDTNNPPTVPHQARSGTSFAAPLAAGVAARILQVEPNLSPFGVWDRMRNLAQQLPVAIDTNGVDQNGNATSNSTFLNWQYGGSSTCTIEYP